MKCSQQQPTGRIETTVPWSPCPCCDEFLCHVHREHACECPCPGLDEWIEAGFDPYLSEITPELILWVRQYN